MSLQGQFTVGSTKALACGVPGPFSVVRVPQVTDLTLHGHPTVSEHHRLPMLTWCEERKALCTYKQSTAQPEPGPVFSNNEVTTK